MRFVAGLREHGERLAVVTDDEQLSYRQLTDRADALAVELGSPRRLVLVEAANDLTTLIGYLGALRGGHVVLLAPRADREQVDGLIDAYDPDVVIDDAVRARRPGTAHSLHPDLGLLLTTSGSTGSPRLVRLSCDSVDANAAAIADYLEITPDDRPATTLPVHYCYGLSVINSNLLRGAALLLSDRSVTDPAFWSAFRRHRGTSLHGVPYTFDLLDAVGFAAMDLPDLRYVTQAGGRLAPERVRHWAEVGTRHGWRLFVMYGQTEATARMAYLPPELALTRPEAIGVPIPGGTIEIERRAVAGATVDDGAVGELVYRGPNVMLGYATRPADLGLGRAVTALRTGDLGRRRPDGLLEVIGRASRFVKPFGVRVDLDALEEFLSGRGVDAACTGDDARIVVAVTGTDAAHGDRDLGADVRSVLASRLPLPTAAVTVVVVAELPRLPTGKVDHPGVARLADTADGPLPTPEGTPRARFCWPGAHPGREGPRSVREIFARTFPGRPLDDEASFVDLGGDSLTYVQVGADVERVLGHLPEYWDQIPLGALAATPPRRTAWATVETVVLLRALAIVLVVGEHTHLWSLLGGAHLLLAVSGWTFARFVLAARRPPDSHAHAVSAAGEGRALPRRILRSAAMIAVPSSLWIAFRASTQNDVHYRDALLAAGLFHPLVQGYWFVDALVQILLLAAAAFAVPALRRLERRHPFGLPAAALALAQLLRLLPGSSTVVPDLYSTHLVLWFFLLGWTAYRARTRLQLAATVAATALLVFSFFGTEIERAALVIGGLLVLLWLPRVRLPRVVATAVTALAAASLGIYLTHFALLPLLAHGVPSAVLVPVALALGAASWTLATALVRRAAVEIAIRRTTGDIGASYLPPTRSTS